jgi:hypothetical protein
MNYDDKLPIMVGNGIYICAFCRGECSPFEWNTNDPKNIERVAHMKCVREYVKANKLRLQSFRSGK